MADLALSVSAPSKVAANQLPFSGNLRGQYSLRAGRIDMSALSLATPHTRLQASGTLGSTAALKLTVDSTGLNELQPMLSAMGNGALPVELAGAASFNGTVDGRLQAPQIAGHLQATNFTYIYQPSAKPLPQPLATPPAKHHWYQLSSTKAPPPAAPPAATPTRIHIDQFSGDVQYSQAGAALHHAVVQEGATQLSVDGSTTLDKGKFTRASLFQVQAAMHNANVAELQRAFDLDYPVSGKLNFNLKAAGTEADVHGQGNIVLTDGEAYGRPIKSFTSNIAFANQTAQLEDIHLQAARGSVVGSASYDFRNEGMKLDLIGHSIDLAEIPAIQRPRLQVAGETDFTVKGSGTLRRNR